MSATASAAADRKTLALIAHDAKKSTMVEFASRHKDELAGFDLIATGTTGGLTAEATGLAVTRMLSGPMGGDAQIAALVATGKCHAVFFFVDPLSAHPHEPDINSLQRICHVHDCPLASNKATAELVLKALVAKS